MEPTRTYDYLAQARTRILDWTRPLNPDQYTQKFSIGLGSLARTLTHTAICEWAYVQRILQQPVPPYKEWPMQDEQPPTFAALEAAWTEQADRTRSAIKGVGDWSEVLEYRVDGIDKPVIITASKSDIFTQLCFHEVHHRAQVMNMLRQLGVAAEDIDFNTLMYKRRPASS